MALSESDISAIRNYLILIRKLREGADAVASLTAQLERSYGAKIKEAKQSYPMEFVNNITILISPQFLKQILSEVIISKLEQKERACVLVFELKYSEDTVALRLIGFTGYDELVARFGELERGEGHINIQPIKDFCKQMSHRIIMFAPLHTHVKAHDTPSEVDLNQHMFGFLDFIGLYAGKDFVLIPFRADCKVKEEKLVGGRFVEQQVLPSYLKVTFKVGKEEFKQRLSGPTRMPFQIKHLK